MSKLADRLGRKLLRCAAVAGLLVVVSLSFAVSHASAGGLTRDSSCYGPCPTDSVPTTAPAVTTPPATTPHDPVPQAAASSTSSSGSLAFTGTDAITVSILGASLVLIGGAVLLMSHRRRAA